MLLREGVLNSETNYGLRPGSRTKEEQLVYRDNVYWTTQNDEITDGPFCPLCYDDRGKKVHAYPTSYVTYGPSYECKVCENFVPRDPAFHPLTEAR